MNQNKDELRLKYKIIRETENKKNKDSLIIDKLLESSFYKNADTVLVYSSIGTEIDTMSVIRDALCNKKTVALPVCTDKDGHMDFYEIKNEDSLCKGMFSISEPDINNCHRVSIQGNTVCIVPGIAFDRRGYRLGYGKGYYDRFLSNFKGVGIGLCYEKCFCDCLPADEYDCKVNIVITEKNIYNFNEEEYIYG